jgi:hypothetical protein
MINIYYSFWAVNIAVEMCTLHMTYMFNFEQKERFIKKLTF